MSDFAPPPGPPPPKVPEGWKAVWNDQYSEWFYVNIYTKKSQWDKPTEPGYPSGEQAPTGAPPSYSGGESRQSTEKNRLSSNNPYADPGGPSNMTEDERLARQLQEEENARAHGGQSGQGASGSYYQQSGTSQTGGYPQQSGYEQQTHEQGKSKSGLLGKLLGKATSSHSQPQHYGNAQPHYGGYAAPYGQPAGYYGGGGYPMGGGMGGRRPGGGLGAGGGAALGLGGGLLGGMMLGNAMGGDGGDGGGDFGGDGGDYGGGDGGGDFGGGDGGGDFGGGDMGGGD